MDHQVNSWSTRADFEDDAVQPEAGERGSFGPVDEDASSKLEAQAKRTAIRRALVAHGIHSVSRGAILLPHKFIFWAKIS